MCYHEPVIFNAPKIMGILNVTPDSFSDGGLFTDAEKAVTHAIQMIDGGADIIDIGAESTGPDSENVTLEQELERLRPIIDALKAANLTQKALFSIDTYKAPVARFALENGFGMVNDVTALRGDSEMIKVLLEFKPYVVLMYSKDDTARTSKEAMEYVDVIESIKSFLDERTAMLIEAGFPKEKIILDPGMGAFISTIPDYSFEVINRLGELKSLGYPVLVGISRKSCLGGKLEERDPASVEWSLKAISNGADIIRIHNVKALKSRLS